MLWFFAKFNPKEKQHILTVLKEQGFQPNGERDQPAVIFLTDGAANLRQLQELIVPNSIHILDWFHLTMRFTVTHRNAEAAVLTRFDQSRFRWKTHEGTINKR